MSCEAYLQLLLQLFVLTNDGLPDGQLLFIPQAVINIVSIIISCSSLCYGQSEIRLYVLYGGDPTVLKVVISAVTLYLPGFITTLNVLFCGVFSFLAHYVNAIPCYNFNFKIQLDTKLFDAVMVTALLIFICYFLWYFELKNKLNILKEAKLEISENVMHRNSSIFMLLKDRNYERNLVIIVKKFIDSRLLLNIFQIVVCSFNIHTFDFNSLDCLEHFLANSCNLLENRLNRFNNFFLFSLTSGVIIIVYDCIVSLPQVTKIMVNLMLIVLEEDNTEIKTNHALKEDVEDVKTPLLIDHVCNHTLSISIDKQIKRRYSM